MIIFVYDKTFEGLLTAVFDAYSRRTFPDLLVTEGEPFPLFYDEAIRIYTDDRKAERVWKGLEKKISKSSLSGLTVTWLSELPEVDLLLFRYIRKAIDAPATIEFNLGDPAILETAKIWKKVNNERLRVMQFFRFQKRRMELTLLPSHLYITYYLWYYLMRKTVSLISNGSFTT